MRMKHEKIVDLIEELIDAKNCGFVGKSRQRDRDGGVGDGLNRDRVRKIKHQLVQLMGD